MSNSGKYKFEDINIGDAVIFKSTEAQSNYDLYWDVLEKLEKEKLFIVGLDEMGYRNERWTISIDDIILKGGSNKK